MKTLGRIVIILAVFALVMGIAYVAVNAGSSNNPAGAPQFDRIGVGDGDRPEFPGGERDEFRGEPGGVGWIFGWIKNIGVVGIIVALIVLPKSWMQKKKPMAPVASE